VRGFGIGREPAVSHSRCWSAATTVALEPPKEARRDTWRARAWPKGAIPCRLRSADVCRTRISTAWPPPSRVGRRASRRSPPETGAPPSSRRLFRRLAWSASWWTPRRPSRPCRCRSDRRGSSTSARSPPRASRSSGRGSRLRSLSPGFPRGLVITRSSRTSKDRFFRLSAELLRRRHLPVPVQGKWLSRVVQGHYNYSAVPTNIFAVAAFRQEAVRLWHRALSRRSQKGRVPWKRMARYRDQWIPNARILHPWPEMRFDVRTRDRSPVRW